MEAWVRTQSLPALRNPRGSQGEQAPLPALSRVPEAATQQVEARPWGKEMN